MYVELDLFPNQGGQPSTRVQRFEARLPGRRLRCECGRQLQAYDFELLEPGTLRAVCSCCHREMLIIKLADRR
jgi:hypothetical protein